jgi:predicted alpha/beta hydrolase
LNTQDKLSLWLKWVGANALAELVGLGATFAIDFLIIARSAGQGMLGSLVSIVLVTASGAVEGSVVGLLQWSVLRRPFPSITRRAWVLATIVGAMVAWFFGSLPSTLIDMGSQQSGTEAQEPSSALVLLLAAG